MFFVLQLCVSSAAATHLAGPGSETSGMSAFLRELCGGSKLRDFLFTFLMDDIPDIIVGSAAGKVTQSTSGMYEQTFISPAVSLSNGEIANRWLPIDWPHGHIAVKAFAAELVKSGPSGEVPPLTPCCGGDSHVASREEVFMHHWTVNKWQLPAQLFQFIVNSNGLDYSLAFDKAVGYIELLAGAGLNDGANGPCFDSTLHLYFGIGNEVRSMTKEGKYPYEFPDPYGIEFHSSKMRSKGEFMVLNTHLIDIRGVRDKRACTECKCEEIGSHGFSNLTEGGLSCCHSTNYDGGRCHLKQETQNQNQTYYVRYTVKWRSFTPETKTLEVITFDATDNNTKWGDFAHFQGGFMESHEALKSDPTSVARINDIRSGDFLGQKSCHIEWYVPPCQDGTSCTIKIQNSWEMPWPAHIVFLRNHFHPGGVNMSTYTDDFFCTGHSSYDDNENLVDISTCTVDGNSNGDGVMRVEKGQKLSVESVYKQDALPRYGVMSMSFVYAHIPRQQEIQV